MTKNACIIVAAGRGSRISSDGGPKQYRLLNGKSVLQHTIEAFANHQAIDAIQVVIHADDHKIYHASVDTAHPKLLEPIDGGQTRQASCFAGVKALGTKFEKVLIHDAARPFVTHDVISGVLNGVSNGICALPATPIADTVKLADADNQVIETIPRNGLHTAQTPQGFMLSDILSAHQKAAQNPEIEFTDDAAVAEHAGMNVCLTLGDRANYKITTQQDLDMAEVDLAPQQTIPDIRTGSGYDVHTLGPGDEIILCGVRIPHDQSLQGHSDADVGLHALTDALLGTIGAGDIGVHFPPSDPKWKGASSDQFLVHAIRMVAAEGGTITNLDVTIICEAPKITPHRDLMRQSIANLSQIDINRISVKATTNEKIGFIGRGEGIAALASATVYFGTIK